jgi:eukaryotic-like serine/threonine-protein kinase
VIEPGQILDGRYRIEHVLGRGGMGVVLVATHLELDDRVAIKCLLPHAAENRELVARFVREGRATRKITSEHVVRVTDSGMLPDGAPYLVMEYLDGIDLAQKLDRDGALPVSEAVDYVLQVCEALAEAHALGIVHRDLKPANLFVTRRRDGSACVKVLDFGISKSVVADRGFLTKTSGVMGSPLYMSPEQLQSARDVDHRADIWALGVVLFELIAGSQPFRGDTLPQLTISIMMQPPASLRSLRGDVPPQIEAVIEQCLQKSRHERFRSVGALASALAPFAPASARLSIERTVRVAGAPTVASDERAEVSAPGNGSMPTTFLSTTEAAYTDSQRSDPAGASANRMRMWPIVAGFGIAAVLAVASIVSLRGGRSGPSASIAAARPSLPEETPPTEAPSAAPIEAEPVLELAPDPVVVDPIVPSPVLPVTSSSGAASATAMPAPTFAPTKPPTAATASAMAPSENDDEDTIL